MVEQADEQLQLPLSRVCCPGLMYKGALEASQLIGWKTKHLRYSVNLNAQEGEREVVRPTTCISLGVAGWPKAEPRWRVDWRTSAVGVRPKEEIVQVVCELCEPLRD